MRRRGRPPHPDILTPREWEVLSLIEEGASNDEIAQRLGVTARTAKYHVSEIMSKLGVSSREEAVAAIGERGARGRISRWALFVRVAAALAASAVLVGVAFLAWGVLKGGDDSDVPAGITIGDVYSRVLAGATRSDQILHTTFEQTFSETSGNERQLYIGDYWLDVTSDTVRAETHPGRDNTSEDAGDSLFMFQGPYQYYQDSETVALRSDSTALCPGSTSAVLGVLLVCGTQPGMTRDTTVRTDAEWEGHRAVAIETLFKPIGGSASQAPESAPTTTPLATAGQTVLTAPPLGASTEASGEPVSNEITSTLYLDASTFLPLAFGYGYDIASVVTERTLVTKYTNEFVERSSLPADYFDPRSIGYGTPDSAGELTDLARDVPVYWLGEDVSSSSGLPELVLERVEPATVRDAAYLWYRGPKGYPDVSVYLWQPSEWMAHLAAARNALLDDARCSTHSEVTVGQYTTQVFTLPDLSNGVPPPGSCGDRLMNLYNLENFPPAKYFSYVDLGDVVVEFRAAGGEYDSTNGIRTLLTLLHPFTPE